MIRKEREKASCSRVISIVSDIFGRFLRSFCVIRFLS